MIMDERSQWQLHLLTHIYMQHIQCNFTERKLYKYIIKDNNDVIIHFEFLLISIGFETKRYGAQL